MKYVLFAIAFVTFFSCRKSNDNTMCLDGTLLWSGPVEADGLGWALKLDNEQHTVYYLKEPSTAFSKDTGTAVHACIYKSKDKVCSWGGCFDQYGINSINKK